MGIRDWTTMKNFFVTLIILFVVVLIEALYDKILEY